MKFSNRKKKDQDAIIYGRINLLPFRKPSNRKIMVCAKKMMFFFCSRVNFRPQQQQQEEAGWFNYVGFGLGLRRVGLSVSARHDLI